MFLAERFATTDVTAHLSIFYFHKVDHQMKFLDCFEKTELATKNLGDSVKNCANIGMVGELTDANAHS